MRVWSWIYRTGLRALRASARLVPPGESKLSRGLRGRREAWQRLIRWARDGRDPTRPLAWFHAPSVGEGLMARVVMEALRERVPGIQVAYTYFSPSAVAFAHRLPADVRDFMPWDLPDEAGPVLDALEPDVVVFAKTEVWPVLTAEARARGVPAVLVGGALPEGAGRLRWPARTFLRPAFRGLARVGAIAEDDARRFGRLGARAEAIVVTGDPAIDDAADRAGSVDPSAPWLAPFRDEPRPTLVAGSTWPPDEAVLVPAAGLARERVPRLRLVVAPHEPSPEHLEPLEAALRDGGWRTARLGEVEEVGSVEGVDAVIVDRVGVLAQLYAVGRVAWVGGGFGRDGLHSVLEPAAAGIPVLFGPRHANSRAASELLAEGAAREVGGVEEAAAVLERCLDDPDARARAGGAARAFIDRHRGAARRSARMVMEAMEDVGA